MVAAPGVAGAVALAIVHGGEDAPPAIVATDGDAVRRVGAAGAGSGFPFPGGASGTRPAAEALLPLDWNGDYRMDLALIGAGGFSLLAQGEDGAFEQMTPAPVEGTDAPEPGGARGLGGRHRDGRRPRHRPRPAGRGAVGAAQQRRRHVPGRAAVSRRRRSARLRLGRSRCRRGSGCGPARRGRRPAPSREPAGRPVRRVAGVGDAAARRRPGPRRPERGRRARRRYP